MSKTVVGLFSTIAEAQRVKEALIADGFESQRITVVNENNETTGADREGSSSSDNNSYSDPGTGTGIGQKISNFFHSLTGGDEDVHHHYATGINQGGGLIAVTCDDDESYEVSTMLQQYGARDIDSSNTQAASSGRPAYGGASQGTTGNETAIPVIEEQLVVEKRAVDRGGVRVYSHVVEVPVSEDVTLRDERINVERRPVDRAATAADFEAGRGGVIELTATGEEAVVGKTGRVVEEVVVGKEATSRTEAINDSVRRTEVEVEQVPATSNRASDMETTRR